MPHTFCYVGSYNTMWGAARPRGSWLAAAAVRTGGRLHVVRFEPITRGQTWSCVCGMCGVCLRGNMLWPRRTGPRRTHASCVMPRVCSNPRPDPFSLYSTRLRPPSYPHRAPFPAPFPLATLFTCADFRAHRQRISPPTPTPPRLTSTPASHAPRTAQPPHPTPASTAAAVPWAAAWACRPPRRHPTTPPRTRLAGSG